MLTKRDLLHFLEPFTDGLQIIVETGDGPPLEYDIRDGCGTVILRGEAKRERVDWLRDLIDAVAAEQGCSFDRIDSHEGKLSGAYCFARQRITVATVLHFLASGHSVDFVLEQYPTLTAADILEALRLAAVTLEVV